MKQIRCVALLTRFDVLPPTKIMEVVLRRERKQSLTDLAGRFGKEFEGRWKDETVPRILNLGVSTIKKAMGSSAAMPSLDPAELRTFMSYLPDVEMSMSLALDLVEVGLLRRVADEAEQRIGRRKLLPFWQSRMAFIPFTSSCMPQMKRARQCWCDCWVTEDAAACPFCTDGAPEGRTSRVWVRGYCREVELDPLLERCRNLDQNPEGEEDDLLIPPDRDPEQYIAMLESLDHGESEVSQ